MAIANKTNGALIAAAAAGLILSGCANTGGNSSTGGMSAEMVHCSGVNSCKGQTACKSASNSCKGQNSCKGHGWLSMSKEDCDAKGGEVI